MVDFSQVRVNREGFATIKTPVSASGMMRHALDIEAVFNDLLNGTGQRTHVNRMLFTAPTALTISGGVVSAPSLAQHTITSQTGTTDDLDTITASNNTFVMLRATAGHTITLRNGMGNIAIRGGANVVLTGNRTALLWCADGQWSVIGTNQPLNNASATRDPGSADDSNAGYSIGSFWVNTTLDRAWECVNSSAGLARWKLISPAVNGFRARAANTVLVTEGIAALFVEVNLIPTAAPANDNAYVSYTYATPGASSHPIYTTTFNLVRTAYNPIFEVLLMTPASVADTRYWAGLSSAAANNADTLSAGTKFIGFRFSQGVDTGWTPVNNDGTTQAAGTTIGTVATSTVYKLRVRVDNANSRAYFSVNDGAEQTFGTNFPASTDDLGFTLFLGGKAAVTAALSIASAEVFW